jgi:hypothetical protein
MNSHLRIYSISAAVIFVSCIVPVRTFAQDYAPDAVATAKIKSAAAKPTPRMANGHPDLNGVLGRRWRLRCVRYERASGFRRNDLY